MRRDEILGFLEAIDAELLQHAGEGETGARLRLRLSGEGRSEPGNRRPKPGSVIDYLERKTSTL
jgi:hypothetical protein